LKLKKQRGKKGKAKWILGGPSGEGDRSECFNSALLAKRGGKTPLPQWQRTQSFNRDSDSFAVHGSDGTTAKYRPIPANIAYKK
jgi:hypothetical protein